MMQHLIFKIICDVKTKPSNHMWDLLLESIRFEIQFPDNYKMNNTSVCEVISFTFITFHLCVAM